MAVRQKGAVMSRRRRVKVKAAPVTAYATEVMQEISDSTVADLRQAQAEDAAHEDELRRVIEPSEVAA